MKNLNKTPKGIALITVMMMVGVLIMLTAAFFEMYRSHFSLTRSSIATQRAHAGCESVYEYVAFRLEREKTWGAKPFPDRGDSKLVNSEMTISTVPGSHVFTGEIESLDATFTATIYNNLNGGGSTEVQNKAPAGTAYCVVTTNSRESSRRAEFLLDVAPLFDASVLTRADLRVDAEKLNIRSTDPDRNMIRAEGDIEVPGILEGNQTQFLTQDNRPDERGLLWTKSNIYSGGRGGPEIVDTDEKIGLASKNSHGKVVPKGDAHFQIYDINEDGLVIPEDAKLVTLNSDPVAKKGGRWTFVRRMGKVEFEVDYSRKGLFGRDVKGETGEREMWVDVLEFYSDPDSKTPTAVYRGAQRNEDILKTVPKKVDGVFGDFDIDPGSFKVSSLSIPEYTSVSVEIVDNDAKTYGDHGEIRFDLTKQEVTINSDVTVEIDGPFHVTSETALGAETATPPPVLNLGYKANSSADGGVTKATIIAKDTISIKDGVTQGLGRLVSRRGNVEIQPKSADSVSIDINSNDGAGLLVYAGRDVVLTNPDQTKNWKFRGLVYARHAIEMKGGGAAKASFEGTIVSLNDKNVLGSPVQKGINFLECKEVEFIYNPALLSKYVRELPNQQIQVQTVYWKR